MGANIELDIFFKEIAFSFNALFSLLKGKNFSVNVQEFQIFDDWEYTNIKDIDPQNIDLDDSGLFWQKITRLYFKVNNMWRCTLLTSLENAHTLNLSFGLDTDSIVLPGQSDYESILEPVYAEVISVIDESVQKPPFQNYFFAATLGVEHSVDYNNDIKTMVSRYNGGAKWIVSREVGKNIDFNGFVREERKNVIVLTKSFTRC